MTAIACGNGLLETYDGFILDLDGTVYLGDALLPNAFEAIKAIRDAGRKIVYLTNKPLDPSSEYAAKLSRLGLPTMHDEVVSSLDSLVRYLSRKHAGAAVLCVSEPLVEATLIEHGFSLVDHQSPESAQVVVVSFDRTFNYGKLHAAFRAVKAGAIIVATNPDQFCPTPEGGLPDCAAMLAALEACTGVTAEAIVGKPGSEMAEAALSRIGLPAHRVLLIGDRVETDIAMAMRAGMDGALVLSGATTREQAQGSEHVPTYILDGIGDLLTQEPAFRLNRSTTDTLSR